MQGRTVGAGPIHLEVEGVQAIARHSQFAVEAFPTPWIGHYDVVTGPEFCDGATDRPDHACALVPEHLRKSRRIVGVPTMKIRRAHAAGDNFNQDLVASRIAEIKLLDLEGTGAPMHNGGGDLHRTISIYSGASAASATRAIASARYSGA